MLGGIFFMVDDRCCSARAILRGVKRPICKSSIATGFAKLDQAGVAYLTYFKLAHPGLSCLRNAGKCGGNFCGRLANVCCRFALAKNRTEKRRQKLREKTS